MAGMSLFGNSGRAAIGGGLSGAVPKTGQVSGTLNQYGLPASQYSGWTMGQATPNPNIYSGADANYVRNLATSYTPEQIALMKNNATNQAATSNRGASNRIRELMAAQGLSGSGAETGAMTNYLNKANAGLANTLSGIDINAAQTDLANQYNKANQLQNLMGVGLSENNLAEQARQFNLGQYNNMYQFGKQFDYNKSQDALSNQQYMDQLRLMLQLYGMGGGGTGGGMNTGSTNYRAG